MARLLMLSTLALAACATPDTPCCLPAADGGTGCLQRADVPPGAFVARRFVQFGNASCEKKVCISDDSVAQNKTELQGYCSVQCGAGVSCPGSKLGPMECQLLSAGDDGGTGVSVCVRPSDAGTI